MAAAAAPVAAAYAAVKAGTAGVALGGGGFLIPFILGAVHVLYSELGVIPYATPVAGASTGSIVTLVAGGIVPSLHMRAAVEAVSDLCRANGNCFGTLSEAVAGAANAVVPPDGGARANAHGKIYVAVTEANPTGLGFGTQHLFSHYNGSADLKAAIESSTYIPIWSGPSVTRDFRGQAVYDGSMAGAGSGYMPCPPDVSYCIRIHPFPPGTSVGSIIVGNILLGPDRDKKRVANITAGVLTGADVPRVAATLAAHYGRGGKPMTGAAIGQLAHLLVAVSQFSAPGAGGADVWPGRRHALPPGVDPFTWSSYSIAPPDAAGRKAMYELGRAEARSWAEEMGFVKAPAAGAAAGARR